MFGKKRRNLCGLQNFGNKSKTLIFNFKTGTFTVKWYDAKNGGSLQNGSVRAVNGGSNVDLSNPPTNANDPWAIVISKNADPCTSEKNIIISMLGYVEMTVSGDGKNCVNTTDTVNTNEAPDAKFVN